MSNSWAETFPGSIPEPRPADYRRLAAKDDLVRFNVKVEQTDLMISASRVLADDALRSVHRYRGYIKDYIRDCPEFRTSLKPLSVIRSAPAIVRKMAAVAKRADVGPMAAVAGAIAEYVGWDLAKLSPEVIVENGGDIFCSSKSSRSFLVLAEKSAFGALTVRFDRGGKPYGVCTSSGSTGPSFSFGVADAMMVAADDTALADAAATALGNRIRNTGDLQACVNAARSFGVFAAVAVMGDKLAAWGDVELGT